MDSTPRPERKVLIVAYHFPPDGAVGSIRPARFAKHLKALGWEPWILSVRERHIARQDPQALREVEGIPILRTAVWPTLPGMALRLRDRLRPRRGGRPEPSLPAMAPRARAAGRVAGVKRALNSILELPDQQIGWLLPAAWRACRLVRRERIPLVLATAPPRTSSLIGLCVARLCGSKLVTDLRDPWYFPELKEAGSRSRASDAIELRLEREILKGSDLVITTTDHYRTHLLQSYPDLPADRFHTISNGFDAEDFQGLPEAPSRGKFTLSYLGTFYMERTPWALLQALKELTQAGEIHPSGIEVSFTGNVRSAGGLSVEERVRSLGLSPCVKVEDPVPHRDSLRRMKESDVLLLFAPSQPHCIPAKAYEYLGAGKRVLCFAEEGATADLIRTTGAGVVIAPGDIPAIKAALRALYRDHWSGRRSAVVADASRFERRNLSRELAGLLGAMLRPAPPGLLSSG